MTERNADDPEYRLDDVDRGVPFALQRDARNVTAQEMAEVVGVSPGTVRNWIANMEGVGVIEGCQGKIDYERADFQLRDPFVATVSPDERQRRGKEALQVPGVVDVREMVTRKGNLYVEAIATSRQDLASITGELSDRNLDILSSETVTAHYSRPFGEFEC
ncbi:MAG: Lrp/AsnC family leucine-responsive transcriptional regulator [Halobacteriales archaeon]|jgi:Lrp/AsnC family leucine-responsive transcriptional regulator